MMTDELSTIHTGMIIAVESFGRFAALVVVLVAWTGEGRTGCASSCGPASSMMALIFSPMNFSVSAADEDEDDMLALDGGCGGVQAGEERARTREEERVVENEERLGRTAQPIN